MSDPHEADPEPDTDAGPDTDDGPETDAVPDPDAEPGLDTEPDVDDNPDNAPATPQADESVDDGEVLFYEPGGSWWVAAIGPILIGAVLAMEISGPGQVHWWVLAIFGIILTGFSLVQVHAARTHVSVRLTETTLKQGTRRIPLADIATIYPANNSPEHQDWESARALGELPAVPRRRRGVGVKLADGTVTQAWARDVDRFRTELTQAHQAVQMGLPPRGQQD